jgi:hypothetical protein
MSARALRIQQDEDRDRVSAKRAGTWRKRNAVKRHGTVAAYQEHLAWIASRAVSS